MIKRTGRAAIDLLFRRDWIRHVVLVGGALAALSACSSADQEERRWTEDVLLEDGSTVGIERYVVFDETNAMGGGAYNAVESKAMLKFLGSLASLPAWDFPRLALVLYRNTAENWTIVATTTSCEVWNANGEPKPPYWEYQLVGGLWKAMPLSPESIGKKPNLFYRYWQADFPEHITPTITNKRQSDPRIADTFTAVLEKPRTFGCMHLALVPGDEKIRAN